MSSIFLSCLCGSEFMSLSLSVSPKFLSCLCGSEHDSHYSIISISFLSCLCGSEQSVDFYLIMLRFLSCLCGSEFIARMKRLRKAFLSCLCGSECESPGRSQFKQFIIYISYRYSINLIFVSSIWLVFILIYEIQFLEISSWGSAIKQSSRFS